MSWLTALPKGLSHQDCERGDPTKFGGEPPIRFVYDMPEPEDAESRKSTVKIKFDNSEQYFSKFRGGNGEQAVRHMRAFNELVKKKKFESVLAANASLKRAKKDWLAAHIEDSTSEDDVKKTAYALEVEAFKELKAARKSLFEEVFGYYERLLDESLSAQWQDIVREETDTKNFHLLDGTTNSTGKPSGLSWGSLRRCKRRFLLTVVTVDAAECLRRYMMNGLRKALKVTCKQFIVRFVLMNSYLPHLPCLKQQPESPTQMEATNVMFSELDMCTHVLNAMPMAITVAYWAIKGRTIPFEIEKLKEDLTLVENQVSRQEKLLADVRLKAEGVRSIPRKNTRGGEEGKGDGKRARFSPGTKPRDGKATTPRRGKNGKPWEERHCAKCAKWSSENMKSHNTSDCNRWEADGTKIPYAGKFRASSTNSHQLQQNAIGKMQQQVAKLKKDYKKYGNKKRKRSLSARLPSSKRRRTEYSSSSSGSSSDTN